MVDLKELGDFGLIELYKEEGKVALAEAIRKKTEIIESEILRNFIADIILGKNKSLTDSQISRRKRNRKICHDIIYFSGMGIPIATSKAKIDCCQLAAKKYSLSEDHIRRIWAKRNIAGKSTPTVLANINKVHGYVIFLINDKKPPTTLEDIQKIEEKKLNLDDDSLDKLYKKALNKYLDSKYF